MTKLILQCSKLWDNFLKLNSLLLCLSIAPVSISDTRYCVTQLQPTQYAIVSINLMKTESHFFFLSEPANFLCMLIKMFGEKIHVPFNCSMWILKTRATTHVKPLMVLAWPSPTLSIWKYWLNPDSLPSPKSKLQRKAKRSAIFYSTFI